MRLLSNFSLLASLFLASQAWAEGPCPPGQHMVGQRNVPGASYPICQPIPSSNAAPPQSPAVWADRWGAIASDASAGKAGAVVGRASRSEAIDSAMRDCTSNGGRICQLELTFRNQCAAGAWGAGKGGTLAWTSDPYKDGAEKRAVANCVKNSEEGCRVFYSDCSYAERIR